MRARVIRQREHPVRASLADAREIELPQIAVGRHVSNVNLN